MIVRVPVYARKRQRWTKRETLKNRHSTRRSEDGKYTGSVVIARDLGRWTRGSRVKVQLIRLESPWCISAVRIRRERSSIADAAARISTARHADEVGGIDGTPLPPEIVLGSVGLPGAIGPIS